MDSYKSQVRIEPYSSPVRQAQLSDAGSALQRAGTVPCIVALTVLATQTATFQEQARPNSQSSGQGELYQWVPICDIMGELSRRDRELCE